MRSLMRQHTINQEQYFWEQPKCRNDIRHKNAHCPQPIRRISNSEISSYDRLLWDSTLDHKIRTTDSSTLGTNLAFPVTLERVAKSPRYRMRCLSLRRCASSDYCGNPCGQQRSQSGDSSRRCNTRHTEQVRNASHRQARSESILMTPGRSAEACTAGTMKVSPTNGDAGRPVGRWRPAFCR